MVDGAVILNAALAYAEKTIAGEDVLDVVDVLAGNWEPTTRIFTRAGLQDDLATGRSHFELQIEETDNYKLEGSF